MEKIPLRSQVINSLKETWREFNRLSHVEDRMTFTDFIENNPDLLEGTGFHWDTFDQRLVCDIFDGE